MSRFMRFLEALHETRRREAERIIRRYGDIAAQADEVERRRAAEQAAAAEKAAIGRAASRMVASNAS